MYKSLSDKDRQYIISLLKNEYELKNKKDENLGIPGDGYIYHIINEDQNLNIEFMKTQEFLKYILKNNSQFKKVNFINYGDTELVYIVEGEENKMTLLIGQPNIKYGTVKVEFDNLIKLSKKNPNLVITPIHYFCNNFREAYLTPYLYQARCIAAQESGFGSYIPEPNYHFVNYSEEDTYLICKAIIANLILLYDEEKKLGLGACKIGGGDFILEKEYDNEIHTIENTLKRMHLVAARELISIDLKSYINILKEEFSKKTYYQKIFDRDTSILVNYKNRTAMPLETIEDGIQLGLKLRS